jgi:hypothetical protein
MSLSAVKTVLLRAATDAKFRASLLKNPDSLLADFDLTEEERQSLRCLSEDRIANAVNQAEFSDLSLNDMRI